MSPSKFRTIVDDEKKLLTELCEKWEKVLTITEDTGESTTTQDGEGPPSSRTRSKTPVTSTDGDTDASQPANEQQQSLPDTEDKPAAAVLPIEDEELIGLVRATTGQGRMLLGQRFVQFNKLIDDAENKTSEKPIGDDDLQGFWEMIGFQVDDMKEKFQVLEQAEANDWKLPEKKKEEPPAPAPKPKIVKPAPSSTSRTKKAAPSSGMKDFIAQKRREAAAARKKAQEAEAAAGN